MLNKTIIKILDILTIAFLVLFSLNFLLFFGLQGGAGIEQLIPSLTPGLGDVIMMLIFAIVTGALVYFFFFHGRLGGLIFVGILWIFLVFAFVFGIIPFGGYTLAIILWKAIAFIFPLIYLYLIKEEKWMLYFHTCAWAFVIAAFGVLLGTLPGGSALTGNAGVLPFLISFLFLLVSLYMLYRLTMEVMGYRLM